MSHSDLPSSDRYSRFLDSFVVPSSYEILQKINSKYQFLSSPSTSSFIPPKNPSGNPTSANMQTLTILTQELSAARFELEQSRTMHASYVSEAKLFQEKWQEAVKQRDEVLTQQDAMIKKLRLERKDNGGIEVCAQLEEMKRTLEMERKMHKQELESVHSIEKSFSGRNEYPSNNEINELTIMSEKYKSKILFLENRMMNLTTENSKWHGFLVEERRSNAELKDQIEQLKMSLESRTNDFQILNKIVEDLRTERAKAILPEVHSDTQRNLLRTTSELRTTIDELERLKPLYEQLKIDFQDKCSTVNELSVNLSELSQHLGEMEFREKESVFQIKELNAKIAELQQVQVFEEVVKKELNAQLLQANQFLAASKESIIAYETMNRSNDIEVKHDRSNFSYSKHFGIRPICCDAATNTTDMSSISTKDSMPFQIWCKLLVHLYRRLNAFEQLVLSQKENQSVDLSVLVISETPPLFSELSVLGITHSNLQLDEKLAYSSQLHSITSALYQLEALSKSLIDILNNEWVSNLSDQCLMQ